jgi:hypothetical protein
VPPDDEQISARNMYRLLTVINWKQTEHLVGSIILLHHWCWTVCSNWQCKLTVQCNVT